VIIANPIYDVTFKRLLENNRAAKFFIGAILGCEVLSLVPTTQEHTEPVEGARTVTLFRMDFAATIRTKEDGEKRVIIEMQKANLFDDVYRFRKYLGTEYTVSKLPIITIYILGFPLAVASPAFGNVPCYRDLLTNEELVVHDHFVERLTHSAYFVQTTKIKPSLNTKLDKLLSIFEQANFIGDSKTTKDYSLPVDDPEVKAVIDVLRYVAADPQVRKELEKERYYQEAMEDMFGENDKKLAEAVQQKEEAVQQLFQTAKELKYGEKMPASKIAKITGLPEAEIETL
jgi:O6-methylguanine-DNA--protein-cysteine methyltransferase